MSTTRRDSPSVGAYRAAVHVAERVNARHIGRETIVDDNPAAIQRQIQALTAELLTLTTSKAAATARPKVQASAPRASTHESTKVATRAS